MSRFIVPVLLLALLAFTGLHFSHTHQKNPADQVSTGAASPSYWHQGKAEVAKFDLEQIRYGESHPGKAVLIFVKEQFLPEAQVKFDGLKTQETPVDVMKHIATRDFYTGMYPYSVMTTVFSPFSSSERGAYKITGTTQDWCGQTFIQVNDRESELAVQYHSYFQKEGDSEFTVEKAVLEDDLVESLAGGLSPEKDVGVLDLESIEEFVGLVGWGSRAGNELVHPRFVSGGGAGQIVVNYLHRHHTAGNLELLYLHLGCPLRCQPFLHLAELFLLELQVVDQRQGAVHAIVGQHLLQGADVLAVFGL